jgi:hypothetical protein
VERFLLKKLEPILQNNKLPLNIDPRSRVSEIEQFFGILRSIPCTELVHMVLDLPEGW